MRRSLETEHTREGNKVTAFVDLAGVCGTRTKKKVSGYYMMMEQRGQLANKLPGQATLGSVKKKKKKKRALFARHDLVSFRDLKSTLREWNG